MGSPYESPSRLRGEEGTSPQASGPCDCNTPSSRQQAARDSVAAATAVAGVTEHPRSYLQAGRALNRWDGHYMGSIPTRLTHLAADAVDGRAPSHGPAGRLQADEPATAGCQSHGSSTDFMQRQKQSIGRRRVALAPKDPGAKIQCTKAKARIVRDRIVLLSGGLLLEVGSERRG